MNDPIKPENFPERLVWYSMVYIYGFYLLGAIYIVGSVLGVILGLYVGLKWWLQTEATPEAEKIKIHWLIWVWIIGMAMMQVALIIGHLDFDLPTSTIIKSSIGWLKGWAALALYPLAGCLPIRPRLIYRAVCVICLQTLLISPLLIIAPLLHFPEILYVSPLKAVGGPGTTFFDVSFYEVDFDGSIRQRLFTPWGPALGFVANIYFVLALKEKNKKWRWFGIIGSLYLAQICKSRLAIVSLILTPIFTFCLARLSRPFTLMVLGIGSTITGIMAPWLFNLLDTVMRKFTEARSESSRVRTTLKQIAGYRWETEAPIWGHGIVESGPHVVEYMPIGSHHTWYGLLFVKGIVGFYALAIPMVLSLFLLLIKAQRYAVAEAGLAVLFILFLYTFGENLEILAYLYWPGLIIMGLGFYASGDRPDYQ
ncbi:O-antigen ligase domain-containing protein [Synechocystis sp. FACHB-383]|uniref:O-antigen ligase domain-containing protein n=1 Tax=unclassified Synechocystis TaxID=2640012 RepID=UPI0016867C2E|nr:O-antigen ligase domain-containing protein [Synechocystis sp. FACHB-383]MBE9196517.1 O-antigen ligase domain-containing protein [Synechocystis sp. LEGE 06083]